MVGKIASLDVRMNATPQVDTSWLDKLVSGVGDAIDQRGDLSLAREAFGSQAQQPTSFFGRLTGSQPTRPAASPTQTASLMPVDRSQPQGSTYAPFIDTVKTKIQNPYGLSAVAATGRAESGWSPDKAASSWADPSQSGQSGTSGGILSWRAERLQNLRNYAASKGEQGNGSPSTQAEFFLNEDPDLVARLNSAKSPQEAQNMMNQAWRFAGYDKPGGETARRMALAQNYAANDFKDIPFEQGDAGAPQAGYVDPQVTTAERDQTQAQAQAAPVEVADSSGRVIAPAVTPIARGSVNPDVIARMVANPRMRDVGIALWKQNAGQAGGEPWHFVTLPDGTLARANQQTGEVMSLGNFAKEAGGFQVLSAAEREALGIPSTDTRVYQKGPDGKIDAVGGAGQSINIDNGSIPQGFQADRDANGRITRLSPIPGGPADNSTKQAAQAEGRETLTDVITTAAQRAREAVSGATVPTDGLTGRVAGAMSPSSNAAEVRRQVAVLKSNATIETLNAMRQQSPTGGALGAVSDSENAMLAAKAGAIDPDSPTFIRDLDDYERTLLRTVHGKEAGDAIFEQTRTKEPVPAPAPAGVKRISNVEEYQDLPSGTQYIDPNGKLRTKR